MKRIMVRQIYFSIFILMLYSSVFSQESSLRNPDNGDGTYSNPVIYADYSDPDVIRIGNNYFLVSSSFHESPGLPLLHSTDLVNWTIIGHAIDTLPNAIFSTPQQGQGVWAPSIRFHDGEYFIFYGDPDFGIYLVKTNDPFGKWSDPVLVKQGKGLIDPCPFWDEDGNVYLVHAWAKSRVGFNSVLTVHRMNSDGTQLLDEGKTVFDGHEYHPTIEGPKFYKRNGYYYIFAPAGGVKTGWQTVLRGTSPFGPFEDRIVLEQGKTQVNGPHQGAWVDDVNGDSWFIHFQDKGAYGRIVHLQPMKWENDWPVIGHNGEPVLTNKKPKSKIKSEIKTLQTSDDFSSSSIGLQWQWNANYKNNWCSLKDRTGYLRLFGIKQSDSVRNLLDVPNILVQKFPAHLFSATMQCDLSSLLSTDTFGFGVLGLDFSFLIISPSEKSHQFSIDLDVCKDAKENGKIERTHKDLILSDSKLILQVTVTDGGVCTFGWSTDGTLFQSFDKKFIAREGRWIGARIGMFCNSALTNSNGYVDIDDIKFR